MFNISNIEAYVDITTILVCLAIGKIFKSSDITKSLNNKYIPYILLMVGIFIQFLTNGISAQSLSTGIISAAAAVGFHQSGKQIFDEDKSKPTKKKEV